MGKWEERQQYKTTVQSNLGMKKEDRNKILDNHK